MSIHLNIRCLAQLLIITILALISTATNSAQDADRTTGALDFIVQTCTSSCSCQPVTLGLVVDNNWRGFYYNLCYDPKQCDKVEIHFTFIFLNVRQ